MEMNVGEQVVLEPRYVSPPDENPEGLFLIFVLSKKKPDSLIHV